MPRRPAPPKPLFFIMGLARINYSMSFHIIEIMIIFQYLDSAIFEG